MGTPSGKRVYLYYGLNSGGLSMWSNAPYSTMVANFRADGHSVVLASEAEPQVAPCRFTNGGGQYREAFNSAINTMMNTVESTYGAADTNIIGGVSFGGLHAMMGATISGRFAAWFAHVPVVRIDALTEFSSVGDVKKFNPQYEVVGLSAKPGLLTWGTTDARVNYLLTIDLANQLPETVEKIGYAGMGHTTTSQSVADIRAWVLGL
jgi:hypothetical protein